MIYFYTTSRHYVGNMFIIIILRDNFFFNLWRSLIMIALYHYSLDTKILFGCKKMITHHSSLKYHHWSLYSSFSIIQKSPSYFPGLFGTTFFIFISQNTHLYMRPTDWAWCLLTVATVVTPRWSTPWPKKKVYI